LEQVSAVDAYNMARRRRKRRAEQKSKPRAMTSIVMQPPELQVTPTQTHTFRFGSTSATARNVTVGYLLAACGGACTIVNGTLSFIASSMRVKRVVLYAAPLAGADDVGTLNWTEAVDAPDREVVRNAIGASGPSVQTLVPAKNSASGYWYGNGSVATVIFAISSPVGSVVDVTLEYTQVNQHAASSYSIAAGVLGNWYYGYLDGPTAHTYVPIGLPGTF